MNILVIHETEYIEKVVFEYQIIPEIWASAGNRVYVVDYETNWKKSNLFDLVCRTRILRNVRKANKKRGITLIRPGFIKIPVISRISAAINHYYIIKRAIKNYKIDVIFLYSVPTNGLQTIRAARKFGIPVHFRLLDVLHEIVPYKILSSPTYILERFIYHEASELTAITPKLTKYAIKMGARKATTSYLPSGSDSDFFYTAPKSKKLMKQYGITGGDRVVTFAGTLYNFSGLDKVLNYYAKHKNKFKNLKFLIVGSGQQEKKLKSIIKNNNLEKNVVMTGFIQYEKLADYLNLSDICINPFEINNITDIIFPGKIYQYLACSKPVIATKLSGLVDIFPDNEGKNNIYYYDDGKIEEFFGLIKKIKRSKIKDPNPSLQQIAKTLETRLKKLKY